jgi:hypothetical protein
MSKKAAFTPVQAERIKRGIRTIERIPTNRTGLPTETNKLERSFYVKLLDEGTGDDEGWYSYIVVHKGTDADGDFMFDSDPPITSNDEFWARDLNLRTGLADSGEPFIVEVTHVGYRADGVTPALFFNAGGGGESVGQYQHMVHKNVTVNEMGHDWTRAHRVHDILDGGP